MSARHEMINSSFWMDFNRTQIIEKKRFLLLGNSDLDHWPIDLKVSRVCVRSKSNHPMKFKSFGCWNKLLRGNCFCFQVIVTLIGFFCSIRTFILFILNAVGESPSGAPLCLQDIWIGSQADSSIPLELSFFVVVW